MKSQADTITACLREGVTSIMFDARQPGVDVPADLAHNVDLLLNFSFRFEPADLQVNGWGLRATLTFNGQPYRCAVPWLAIHGASQGRTVYRWDRPAEPPAAFMLRHPVARA